MVQFGEFVFCFFFFLDGKAVGRTLGSIDQFIGQALRNALDAAEGRLTSTGGEQVDSSVNTTQRRNVDGLSADGTSRADTSGVFTRTRVDDSLNQDLERVLTSQKVDNFEGVFNKLDLQKIIFSIRDSDSDLENEFVASARCLTKLVPRTGKLQMTAVFWILTDIIFLPLLRPCIMIELVKRSTMGQRAFLNLFLLYLPAVWGKNCLYFSRSLTAM